MKFSICDGPSLESWNQEVGNLWKTIWANAQTALAAFILSPETKQIHSFSRASESFKSVPTEAELLLSAPLEQLGSGKSKCSKWCYAQTGGTSGDGRASPLANLSKQPDGGRSRRGSSPSHRGSCANADCWS